MKILGFTPDVQNWKLWDWNISICVVLGDSDTYSSLNLATQNMIHELAVSASPESLLEIHNFVTYAKSIESEYALEQDSQVICMHNKNSRSSTGEGNFLCKYNI